MEPTADAIAASAPGRVNLIGEHTDYNGGLALPIALPHRTYAVFQPASDRRLRMRSEGHRAARYVDLDRLRPGSVRGWRAYVAGVFWAFERAGDRVPGGLVALRSDVPQGAGLSSSAALTCSVAVALAGLLRPDLLTDDAGRAELARRCQLAENKIAGAPTGGLDQAASLRSRVGHALLLDCRDGTIEHIPTDLAAAGVELLVIDTKAPHRLVDGQYAARRTMCEAAARRLRVDTLREIEPGDLAAALPKLRDDVTRARVRHVVTEIDRVGRCVTALRAGDVAEVGRLFDASHDSLRVDYEVSCPELDTAVASARSAGALGARMTGGGFGGSAIALIPRGRRDAVAAAVTEAFAREGFDPPVAFPVHPAGPAALDESPS